MTEDAGAKPLRPHRGIRSFVLREGRLTAAQRDALKRLWPVYGLSGESTLDLDRVFGRTAPRVLEIGFGNGEALVEAARAHPAQDFIGIEVYRPGIGRLLRTLEASGLGNVRVIHGDAMEVLASAFSPQCLDRVNIYFPDPWPKKRHHKRRLIQPPFVDLLARCLRRGGIVHLATDWADYAEHMRAVMEADPRFENLAGPGACSPRPAFRPATRFEARGLERGHPVYDFLYQRSDDAE